MNDNNFLCRTCRKALCRECRSIADEYAELLRNQKAYLHKAQQQLEQAQAEAERARKRADDYERLMKLGQHALVLAWMDSITPAELLASVARRDGGAQGRKG